ncbi:class I SAM-dependent methyltransferase [Streptomyces griseus]|uniref:class I SAM-dependent methyltransferase n=1 Tax=Streptomyces griseus TaxID=1911 RepID=UPI000840866F|nr:class I SAM-dependent methyltransferase [Streptomyces griseus]
MQHIVNTDQARAWNGYEGTHWARNHDRWNAVNEHFDAPLLAAAAIQEGDRVLDIGCGAGQTTRLAARRAGSGRATGVDLSAPMLERARACALHEGVGNVTFEQGDAQVHTFEPDSFDAAISRFGVMFFADPVAAFATVGRALRPGGRLAFVCTADPGRNEWLQALGALRGILPVGDFGTPDGPGMFSLADPDRIREVLSTAGYGRIGAARLEVRGSWGRDADEAASFLLDSGPGRHLTGQVDAPTAAHARRVLRDRLRAHEEHGAVRLRSAALLVTAVRPG